MTCFECNLPDPYSGDGDGIGSCQCPRCSVCSGPPGVCSCDQFCDCEDCMALIFDNDGRCRALETP